MATYGGPKCESCGIWDGHDRSRCKYFEGMIGGWCPVCLLYPLKRVHRCHGSVPQKRKKLLPRPAVLLSSMFTSPEG